MQTVAEKSDTIISVLQNRYPLDVRRSSDSPSNKAARQAHNQDAKVRETSFAYIHSSPCYLVDAMQILAKLYKKFRDRPQIKVCDLGSGDGMFLTYIRSYLKMMGYNNTISLLGIELNKKIEPFHHTISIRHESFYNTPISVFESQDIFYSYNPMQRFEDNLRLVDRVLKYMKPGACIIFTVYNYSLIAEFKRRGFLVYKSSDDQYISQTYYFVKP